MDPLLLIPVFSALSALAFAGYLTWDVLKRDVGTEQMRDVSAAILLGSRAFLKRMNRTMAIFVAILAAIFGIALYPWAAFAFVLGATTTALASHIGMNVAVRANVRTANSARRSFSDSLETAFRGGAVMGLSVIGLGLLGVSILYIVRLDPVDIVAYGTGSSLTALFQRVGGGIYTKSADVGADLVGKVEAGIPEDDPRNPAVIADNVGDNVGDVAGMGADLFQTYVAALIASMVVGTRVGYGEMGAIFPLLMCSVGVFATIFGVLVARAKRDPYGVINKGMFTTGAIAAVAFYFLADVFMGGLKMFFVMLSGIILALLIGFITQYYTSYYRKPVRTIAEAAQSGPAISIITGLGIGLASAAPTILVIGLVILVAWYFIGVYGVSIAVVGMHAVTGMIVAVDSYGPITDNARGIVQMCGLGPHAMEITDRMDSAGNTTKAISKAFAISDASLAELALFTAFFAYVGLEVISITEPKVIIGLFIGGMIPFVLCSWNLKAVGKGAFEMVKEVRRQFREIPGLMEGRAKPDYARCVDISTVTALREMVKPATLAFTSPIVIGLILGVEALGGLLAGAIISGLLLAIFMATTGNAWDNAKKYIEAGHLGGSGTPTHKAAVIGDTVGDPLKDTAGPSLTALIKSMNTVALLFAPYFLVFVLLR